MIYDVFVSYRRDNGSDLASSMESYLTNRGFNCYLDIENKYSGDFMEYVEQAIKNSSLFLLLITKGSLERMSNPSDISRREIETALDNGVKILPISTIGEDMFDILNRADLPDTIKKIKDFNCRMYKHELREDTLQYIVGVAEGLRKERFDSISRNALSAISKVEDEVLKGYVNEVKDFPMEFSGRRLQYTGKTKFGKPMGRGTLTDLSRGLIYSLDWNPYGTFEGKGQVFKGSDLIYEGEISELDFEGEGRLIENKNVLEGTFREGKLKGKGTLIKPNGTILTGDWLGEELYAKAYIRYVDGSEYWGKTSGLEPHGYGVMIKRDGSKFDGLFRKGVFEEGTVYKGNTVYIGACEDWGPCGKGVMYNKEFRKMFEGSYRNGIPQGEGKLYTVGKIFSDSFLPKEIYDKLKEYYPNFDNMSLVLHTTFDNDKIVNYSEFSLTDESNYQTIASGKIKRTDVGTYSLKIFVNYQEVFKDEIY